MVIMTMQLPVVLILNVSKFAHISTSERMAFEMPPPNNRYYPKHAVLIHNPHSVEIDRLKTERIYVDVLGQNRKLFMFLYFLMSNQIQSSCITKNRSFLLYVVVQRLGFIKSVCPLCSVALSELL